MSAKTVLRTIAGLLGSLAISIGVMLIFVSMVVSNMQDNLDSIDSFISSGMQDFASNNKEDLREFALQQIQSNEVMREQFEQQVNQFTKENLAFTCSNPDIITDTESRTFLTDSGICDIVNDQTSTDEDIKNFMIDRIIEENIKKFDNQDLSTESGQTNSGKEQIKKALSDIEQKIGSPKQGIIIGIITILLGWLLTFVSVKFNFIRGSYRVCLKTMVNLLTTGALFLIFHYVKPETFVNLIRKGTSLVQDVDLSKVPDTMLKQIAQLLINWLQLSTDPLIYIAFISAIPFIILTVIFFIFKLKDKGETTGKEVSSEDSENISDNEGSD